MNKHVALSLFFLSITLFVYTVFFAGARDHLTVLSDQLRLQERERDDISKRVNELKAKVAGIESDPDVLEKVAREELKMLAEDEELIIFDE